MRIWIENASSSSVGRLNYVPHVEGVELHMVNGQFKSCNVEALMLYVVVMVES